MFTNKSPQELLDTVMGVMEMTTDEVLITGLSRIIENIVLAWLHTGDPVELLYISEYDDRTILNKNDSDNELIFNLFDGCEYTLIQNIISKVYPHIKDLESFSYNSMAHYQDIDFAMFVEPNRTVTHMSIPNLNGVTARFIEGLRSMRIGNDNICLTFTENQTDEMIDLYRNKMKSRILGTPLVLQQFENHLAQKYKIDFHVSSLIYDEAKLKRQRILILTILARMEKLTKRYQESTCTFEDTYYDTMEDFHLSDNVIAKTLARLEHNHDRDRSNYQKKYLILDWRFNRLMKKIPLTAKGKKNYMKRYDKCRSEYDMVENIAY